MAKILVIGASRGIGKAVSEEAAARGHEVRAMSRSGAVTRRRDDRIEGFSGNALKAADMERALEGIDTVVQALGVEASLKMITEPVTLFSEATRVLLPAMEKTGVGRLVAVTGFGAGDCASSVNLLQRLPFRALLGRAYDDKTIQETLIEGSDLDWLIVRPGVLTNGPKSNCYRVLSEPAEWRNGIVSRADVADFIVSQLDNDRLGRKKPVIIRLPL
ncbi:NAD-dependent epimerase/dehydratase family protein [Roseibium denhamense]|uniref:NADH-flavin reductase n=2 Tax=Roseibium denhamense TaxID=76305 RepID=A0ABY1P1B0_9HYPH|nr:NAD-dependent epimerase/dehydratase family protein [Roseibium denhamense]SMP23906.1 Putative NADH-flavin reductase [Roseibium denhamense]